MKIKENSQAQENSQTKENSQKEHYYKNWNFRLNLINYAKKLKK